MAKSETLYDGLEDFKARILAVDPADVSQVTVLRERLGTLTQSLEPSSQPAHVLDLAAQALQAVAQPACCDPSYLLAAVASAATAASQNVDEGANQDPSALEHAIEVLGRALQDQEADLSRDAQVPETTDAPVDASPGESQWAPELIAEFVAESCERLGEAEAALLALEANPDDVEQINTVLRAFHTIKGAAGFLGLDHIQKLSHLAENLLARARDGQVRLAGRHADLALRSGDCLKEMIEGLLADAGAGSSDVPGDMQELLGSLAEADEIGGDAQSDQIPAIPACPSDNVAQDTGPECPDSASSRARTNESTVRVGTRRLDDLIDMVGELVIAQSIIAQDLDISQVGGTRLSRSISRAGKIVRDLQQQTMGLRMVPLKGTFQKMTRLVRDLARKSGKPVQLVTAGEETEIDRKMVEALNDPLVHMIRNAVDHGIESAQQRARAGKDRTGTIHLRAYHSTGNVVIELQDDGCGLDRDRIVGKAVKRGLVDADNELSDAEAYSLIFHPGLSTADKLTEVSGRGVGMDVVKRNIDQLRGHVELNTARGQGTTFTLRLPLTMAIVEAMLVRVGRERYMLPTNSILRSFRPEPGSLFTVTGRGEMVRLRDQLLPVFRLHRLFDVAGALINPEESLMVVIEGRGRQCALMVDELLGQQQVVIKSLGDMFSAVRGISGGAILPDGQVGMILDTGGIIELSREISEAA